MDKKIILNNLSYFINELKKGEDDEKSKKLISLLESIKEEDISIGEAPKYFFAKLICNSTGVGVSSFKGSETQRTVAKDYVTDEYLFVDGHMGAAGKGLSLFYLKAGESIGYFSKNDIEKKAKEYGFMLHMQDFRDLNIRLTDHRLNRYTPKITKDIFSYPIYPVFARISEEDVDFTIGYIYKTNGEEYIIIEPDDPKKAKKAKNDKFFAPWMLLGLIFPPVLLAVLALGFLRLVKIQKERMIG